MSEFPVTLTEKAAEQAAKLLAKDGRTDAFLRVGVKGGGCSGLEYLLKIDTNSTPHDIHLMVGDIRVVSDTKSAPYLQGATLEHTGNLIGGGFTFINPNADRQCGCGTSFTVKRSSA